MTSKSLNKTSVDVAIPVYNEQKQLRKNVLKVNNYSKRKEFNQYKIRIIIVDNASTDDTGKIAKTIAQKYKNINFIQLNKKGRGRALRKCWTLSKAEIVAYMDVDLSADIKYLSHLLSEVSKKEVDIAIGSRLTRGAKVSGRTITREIMSRVYNLIIKLFFNVSFKDAQCGFKAITTKSFNRLEPLIKNQNWFFDSELLIIAHKKGMTISEIPIAWRDDPSSTVKVAKTATEDLLGLVRLRKTKPWKGIS